MCVDTSGTKMEEVGLAWGCEALLEFHMLHIANIIRGHSEMVEALESLKLAIAVNKCGGGFRPVEFHIQRLGELKTDSADMNLHLSFLQTCIRFLGRKMEE